MIMSPYRLTCVFLVLLYLQEVTLDENISNYENYRVYQILPTTVDQVNALTVMKTPSSQLQIFKYSSGVGDPMEVLVGPNLVHFLDNYSKMMNMTLILVEENYQRLIEESQAQSRRSSFGFSINKYNSFNEMQDYISKLAQMYPNIVTVEERGKSFEGRPLNLVKLSQPGGDCAKPVIFVDAGIHAREWVATAMGIFIIHSLVENPKYRPLLERADWYILPSVNPDGYEFSRSSPANRLWRKTRSKSALSKCFGVDGNRNYGYEWAVSGATINRPCDPETYAGPRPFSESETRAVRDIMLEHRNRIKLYVSLHSYGQYLVYPWGYTGNKLPRSWRKLHTLAKRVSDSVVSAGGEPFTVTSAGKWYAAAGGSDDYAFGVAKVPYSYTMELTKGYNFAYPESYLARTLPVFMEGFRTFGEEISKEFSSCK